jgi:biopolymer transport protein ExbD
MPNFRRKHTGRQVEISTAALPDIIFMLLFFFMISATVRPPDDQLKYKIPSAEELIRQQHKEEVTVLLVGYSDTEHESGTVPKIVSGGQFLTIDRLQAFIIEAREKLPMRLQARHTILLKADEEVPMGIISDIQQELRKVNARRIMYAANWKND